MDPCKILNLPQEHTLEQLRYNYKVLARQLHPDKCGTRFSKEQATATFQLLTDAYRSLLKQHQQQSGGREVDHAELRGAFREEKDRYAGRHNTVVSNDAKARKLADDASFDLTRFNTVYEENRSTDGVRDGGYGDWMMHHEPDDPAELARNRQIVRYVDPMPVAVGRRGCIPFTELGVERVDDYSRADAVSHGIQYTDYRVAHTTTKLVNERVDDGRPAFRSVEDLQKHRATVRFVMTDEEAAAHAEAKRRADKDERRRVRTQQRTDEQLEQHFDRVHRLVLGYAPKA